MRLDSESEPRYFSDAVVQIVRVSKVEIAKDSVLIRARELTQSTVVINTLRSSEDGSFLGLLGSPWVVVLRAHINRVGAFLSLIYFSRLADLEGWNRVQRRSIISARSWNLIIGERFWLLWLAKSLVLVLNAFIHRRKSVCARAKVRVCVFLSWCMLSSLGEFVAWIHRTSSSLTQDVGNFHRVLQLQI